MPIVTALWRVLQALMRGQLHTHTCHCGDTWACSRHDGECSATDTCAECHDREFAAWCAAREEMSCRFQ